MRGSAINLINTYELLRASETLPHTGGAQAPGDLHVAGATRRHEGSKVQRPAWFRIRPLLSLHNHATKMQVVLSPLT